MNDEKIIYWNDRHAVVMLIGAVATFLTKSLVPIFAIGLLSFTYYIYLHRDFLSTFKPFAGYANYVTGLRLLLFSTVLIVDFGLTPFALGVILAAGALLDVVDGYLAKKYNQASTFGQFFDMEVDALFVLAMCFFYYLFKDVPMWVIVPGLLRYAFSVSTKFFPRIGFKEKKRPYASFIAGVFFTILILSLVLSNAWQIALLGIGSLLIVFSFAISFYEYFSFRPAQ